MNRANFLKRKIHRNKQLIQIIKDEIADIQRELLQIEKRPTNEADPNPPVISIPLIDGTEFHIYPTDINSWNKSYPAVDILQELRSMREWCLSNPRKKKTPRGVRKFITGWLARCQDRGGSQKKAITAPFDDRPLLFPMPK